MRVIGTNLLWNQNRGLLYLVLFVYSNSNFANDLYSCHANEIHNSEDSVAALKQTITVLQEIISSYELEFNALMARARNAISTIGDGKFKDKTKAFSLVEDMERKKELFRKRMDRKVPLVTKFEKERDSPDEEVRRLQNTTILMRLAVNSCKSTLNYMIPQTKFALEEEYQRQQMPVDDKGDPNSTVAAFEKNMNERMDNIKKTLPV